MSGRLTQMNADNYKMVFDFYKMSIGLTDRWLETGFFAKLLAQTGIIVKKPGFFGRSAQIRVDGNCA